MIAATQNPIDILDGLTDSPIEALLLVGLLEVARRPSGRFASVTVGRAGSGFPPLRLTDPTAARLHLTICTQSPIGPYRVDFVVGIFRDPQDEASLVGPAVVVECDGHDFHDRTREQASRDRARDRVIMRDPRIVVLRFTGSDLHANPARCGAEVLALIARRAAA